MRPLPGIGEVTGAIMLTASFAVAAAVLFSTFQERMDAAEAEAGLRLDVSMRQAVELVHAGPAHCGHGFLLHNYSPRPMRLGEVTVYAGGGRVYAANVSYTDMGGGIIETLGGGSSAWAATDAPCPLVVVTPAGVHIRVGA